MSNTRAQLIEVARQLFASKGFDGTTMNEIAHNSGKGRRTLYTYFKSKADIFMAAVNQETSRIIEHVEDILELDLPADEKLKRYILCRLDQVKETVVRNGTLKGAFFRDVIQLEPPLSKATGQEKECLPSSRRASAATRAPRSWNLARRPLAG